MWSRRKGKKGKKKNEEKKERRAEYHVRKTQGTVSKQKLKHSTPARSGDTIKVKASASMQKSPDASGALVVAMGSGAVATPTGRMPVGNAAPRDTWPGAVRRSKGVLCCTRHGKGQKQL